jgi:hypothetical protein
MMQFKGALLKKVTRPKLADMRVKERLFDNTYICIAFALTGRKLCYFLDIAT